MNLTQQSNELKSLYDKLILSAEKRADGLFTIRNWMALSNTLNNLKKFDFISYLVDEIFKVDDNINIRIDIWTTKPETYELLLNKITVLKGAIGSCIKLINEYTNDNLELTEGTGILNTRMPDDIDMKKMSSICSDLDKVFNQCPLIEDEIKFIGVEKGSVYFIFLTTVASINVVGGILNAALDVQRKYYQNQMMKNKLEAMDDIGDAIKLIVDTLEKEVMEFSRVKAMEIEESQNLNPEEQERLALSIRTLSKLIGEGVQMQCSLSENEETSDISFPKADDFRGLMEGIKMLNGN